MWREVGLRSIVPSDLAEKLESVNVGAGREAAIVHLQPSCTGQPNTAIANQLNSTNTIVSNAYSRKS